MMVRAIAIGLVCGCTSLSAPLQADQRNALPRIGVLALAIPASKTVCATGLLR
jgi:hypothetical protein